jgi:hypothetical protein
MRQRPAPPGHRGRGSVRTPHPGSRHRREEACGDGSTGSQKRSSGVNEGTNGERRRHQSAGVARPPLTRASRAREVSMGSGSTPAADLRPASVGPDPTDTRRRAERPGGSGGLRSLRCSVSIRSLRIPLYSSVFLRIPPYSSVFLRIPPYSSVLPRPPPSSSVRQNTVPGQLLISWSPDLLSWSTGAVTEGKNSAASRYWNPRRRAQGTFTIHCLTPGSFSIRCLTPFAGHELGA